MNNIDLDFVLQRATPPKWVYHSGRWQCWELVMQGDRRVNFDELWGILYDV